VSATEHIIPERLTFSYSEEEVWVFRKLAAARVDRGPSIYAFWAVMIPVIFGIAFAVLAVFYAGMLGVGQLRAVLFTAYLAFSAGAGTLFILIHLRSRQLARKIYEKTKREREIWQVAFDDAGLTCKSDTLETRVSWRAMTGIENWGSAVTVGMSRMQSFAIPARVFRDDAARTNFIAAVAARIAAAKARAKASAAP